MNEDHKKRGLTHSKLLTAVAISSLLLSSGNVMAAQTASNDSQGVQEQMQSISVTVGKSSVSCPLKPSDSAPLC